MGASLVALVLLVTQVLLPFARRWGEREALIEATRSRLARLELIAGRESEIADRVRARNVQFDLQGVRLIHARTPALAASELQAFIREQARASGVAVTRMDVAGVVDAVATPAVPATVSAVGDIYGVGRFLELLQHGPRLLEVRELSVTSNPVLTRGLLQMSLTVHAPFVAGE
jgi:hypothetical protein